MMLQNTFNVLVVADLLYSQRLIELTLRSQECKTRGVAGIQEALRALDRDPYDLLILDLTRNTNESLLMTLQEKDVRTPVFVLAVPDDASQLLRLKSFRVEKLIPKPIHTDLFRDLVYQHLGILSFEDEESLEQGFSYSIDGWCEKMENPETARQVFNIQLKGLDLLFGGITLTSRVIEELLAMMEDPRVSATQLTELISRDMALSARLLQVVNSSHYGFSGRIGDIHQAVVILGFRALCDLAKSFLITDTFHKDCAVVKYDEFIAYGNRAAIAARLLAQFGTRTHPEEMYIAGLLHDVAKMYIDKALPQAMIAIQQISKELHPKGWLTAERRVLGMDHARLGGWLSERWSYPEMTREAIFNHHEPHLAPIHREAASVMHLAEVIALQTGGGCSVCDADLEINPYAMSVLNLHPNNLDSIKLLVEQQAEEITTRAH